MVISTKDQMKPIADTERITQLRARVIVAKDPDALTRLRDTAIVDARSLRDSADEPSWVIRRGMLTHDRLLAMRFALDDLELMVGRLRIPEVTEAALAAARAELEPYDLDFPGQTGHCELELAPLMACGLDGLAARIAERRANLRPGEGDTDQDATLRAFALALDGLSAMIARAADDVASVAASAATPERRAELDALAGACRHIAHHAPRTFLEAIQLLWFVLIGVMQAERAWLVGPGHLDRTLYPFYEAGDRESVV